MVTRGSNPLGEGLCLRLCFSRRRPWDKDSYKKLFIMEIFLGNLVGEQVKWDWEGRRLSKGMTSSKDWHRETMLPSHRRVLGTVYATSHSATEQGEENWNSYILEPSSHWLGVALMWMYIPMYFWVSLSVGQVGSSSLMTAQGQSDAGTDCWTWKDAERQCAQSGERTQGDVDEAFATVCPVYPTGQATEINRNARWECGTI